MKTRLIPIPLLALACVSCDKAKDIANTATSAVKEQILAQTAPGESTKPDPELQKLVDQTDEGAIFRKDLPFPEKVEVRTTRRHDISGRFQQVSAIDQRSEVIHGTQVHVFKLERASDHVRFTLEQADFSKSVSGGTEAATKTLTDPRDAVTPTTRPVTFHKTGGTWKADDREGFRAAVLSKELAPAFEELLIDNALSPRPLWFSKRRFKVGDQLEVSGDSLPMLLAGNGKGSIHLKLEAFEAVAGHPCGVFSVSGNYSRKKFPDFEGNLTDEDVTIQSGKIWLSLIHPIVLREELETIQSTKTGGQGGLSGRGQGSVKVSVKRVWKAL
jgi:hypothetical protein